jgi:hypothetical protein
MCGSLKAVPNLQDLAQYDKAIPLISARDITQNDGDADPESTSPRQFMDLY